MRLKVAAVSLVLVFGACRGGSSQTAEGAPPAMTPSTVAEAPGEPGQEPATPDGGGTRSSSGSPSTAPPAASPPGQTPGTSPGEPGTKASYRYHRTLTQPGALVSNSSPVADVTYGADGSVQIRWSEPSVSGEGGGQPPEDRRIAATPAGMAGAFFDNWGGEWTDCVGPSLPVYIPATPEVGPAARFDETCEVRSHGRTAQVHLDATTRVTATRQVVIAGTQRVVWVVGRDWSSRVQNQGGSTKGKAETWWSPDLRIVVHHTSDVTVASPGLNVTSHYVTELEGLVK